MTDPARSLDIRRVFELLPHRYPFLLVDRVTEVVPGVSVKAYKNVTINEPFFQGHFPGMPIMPGVLMLEAMAQAGCFIVLADDAYAEEVRKDRLFLITGVDKVRFRRPVHPGDRLDLECVLTRHRMMLWRMSARASVDGVLCAQAEMTAAMNRRGDM